MKNRFVIITIGFTVLAIFVIVWELKFFNNPYELHGNTVETTHTYLVNIPNSAGICPYEIMSITHGRLKYMSNSGCVCPYNQSTLYIVADCKNKEDVEKLLPESLRVIARIQIADKVHSSNLNIYVKSI